MKPYNIGSLYHAHIPFKLHSSIRRGRTYIQKCKNSILKSKSHFPTWTCQFGQIRMGDNTINAIKKPGLVQKIITLKGKVIVDSVIFNLCKQISKLNDTISQLHSTNKKISDLTVLKNVNAKLEERIISCEKSQAKSEQYSWHNNIELSGILNDIPEDNLEKVVTDIRHNSDLEIKPKDIKECYRLPASRYSRDSNKRVIVKFVNRKHPEAILRNKKSISNKDFSHLNVHGKVFVSVSLCPYYRYIWGKCKDLQRRGKIYQVFCLGGTIAVKVTKHSSAMKIFHECDLLDLDTDDV